MARRCFDSVYMELATTTLGIIEDSQAITSRLPFSLAFVVIVLVSVTVEATLQTFLSILIHSVLCTWPSRQKARICRCPIWWEAQYRSGSVVQMVACAELNWRPSGGS